jgi:ABC-2 type transport system ATP-binding protein
MTVGPNDRTPLPTRLPDTDFAIRTEGLSKRYGTAVALQGIDLTVPTGAVYVLAGPNGAGKTTTLRILLDLARADAGRAEVAGLDPVADGARVRAQVGYMPEGQKWEHARITVSRLIKHHASYFPAWDGEYAARLVSRLRVALDRPYGNLSKGQAKRVQLVLALAHRPPVLLLDEPTDGLDPATREETLSVLADHVAAYDATLLISTHHVQETDRLASHLGVLRGGALRAQLPTAELHARLRRYWAEVPEGWAGSPGLNGAVMRRTDRAREILWTVWGEEDGVRAQLTNSGAVVCEISPLSLEEATASILAEERREVTDV